MIPVPVLTERQKDYAKFLQTPFWIELSKRCKKRDRFHCIQCSSNKLLQAHHLHYDRPSWFDTQIIDLVTLCDKCHDKVHNGTLVISRETIARSRQLKPKKFVPKIVPHPPKVHTPNPKKAIKALNTALRRKQKSERRALRKQHRKEQKRLNALPKSFNDESIRNVNGNVIPEFITQFIPYLTEPQKKTVRHKLESIFWKHRPEWPSRFNTLYREILRWPNVHAEVLKPNK